MKYCPKCKKEKSKLDFCSDKTKVDGLSTNCKHCKNLYRSKNPLKSQPYSIQEIESDNDKSKRLQEEWLAKNKPTLV